MAHVLLVSYEFPPFTASGGIATYMNNLSILLHDNGCKVTVFSASPSHNEVTRVEYKQCINYLIPCFTADEFRLKCLKLFDKLNGVEKFDVMESPEVGASGLLIKQQYPAFPLIVKMHTPGVLITRVSRTYQSFLIKLRYVAGALKKGNIDLGYWSNRGKNKEQDPEYIICKNADALLSPSKALKKWAETYWSLDYKEIKVFPNPFVFHPELLSNSLTERKKQICFVGKLSVLKGLIAFTKSIPLILTKFPEYTVVIVGRDEIEDGRSMKDWMEKNLEPYKSKILFTGVLTGDALRNVYGESEVFICPSLWENYPSVVMEAMAGGAAVAASNRGGIPEIINDSKNGVLFNPLSPKSIFKAISFLLSDQNYRIRITLEARKYIFELQNQTNKNEELLKLYTGLSINKKFYAE